MKDEKVILMSDDEIILQMKTLLRCKSLILNVVETSGKGGYIYYSRDFSDIESCHRDFVLKNMNSAFAHMDYIKALKTHKRDPYIVGGAAQGIAGTGAGILTTLNQMEQNDSIENWRNEAEKKANIAKEELNKTRYKCSETIRKALYRLKHRDDLMSIYNKTLDDVIKEEAEAEEKENKKSNNRFELIIFIAILGTFILFYILLNF